MKQKQTKMFSRAAMTLLLSVLTTMTAWANDAVTYIDMDGNQQSVSDYTEVTSSTTGTWDTGTYVVKSSVTLDGCINFDGKVINLIVCDGAKLTVNGNEDYDAFKGTTLNIYAQNKGEGMGEVSVKERINCSQLNIAGGKVTLDADRVSQALYIYDGDASGLTVNGGDVTIENNSDSQGAIAFHGHGSVTLNGGKLTVTNSYETNNKAIIGQDTNTINFNGGTAEINGKILYFKDINLNSGSVTVNGDIHNGTKTYTVTYGYTSPTDNYYIKEIGCLQDFEPEYTVQVKEGKTFVCNGNCYSGTLTNEQVTAINGHTMQPDNGFSVSPDGNTYHISSTEGWGLFCSAIDDNAQGFFSGKTVMLARDIEVSRMAGNEDKKFTGTFDGCNHKLTFRLQTVGENYIAPFRYVAGSGDAHAVIRNLNVATNITSVDYRHTAGLIAQASGIVDVTNCNVTANITAFRGSTQHELYPAGLVSQVCQVPTNTQLTIDSCTVDGTIRTDGEYAGGMVSIVQSKANINNSVSSITISSGVSGNGSHGGFVSLLNSDCTLGINGCLFNGKIVTTDGTTHCGGFLGLGYDNSVPTITNCLYSPATPDEGQTMVSTDCATFGRNVNNIGNCYYTQTLGTAQGKQLRSISSKDEFVTTLEISGTPLVHATSGITAYVTGIMYNGVFYAGYDDPVSLKLIYDTDALPNGYRYDGFTTNAGTISGSENPYTLTMPDEDVTVSVIIRKASEPVSVRYIKADGTSDTHNAIALDGTESTLGQNEQETWYFVGTNISYSSKIEFNGDVHIILVDGKTMTIESGNDDAFYGNQYGKLTIYGQDKGTGTINATSKTNDGFYLYTFGYEGETLNIYGGTVNATGQLGFHTLYGTINISGGTVNAYGGIQTNGGNINISGGTVTATGAGLHIHVGGTINISGGRVTADNSDISTSDYEGTIILGWTNPSDFIKASRYVKGQRDATLKIADGQTLYDENGKSYSGTIDAIDGKTLTPNVLALYDSEDNSSAISSSDEQQRNVILYDRTLYKDGEWNTLCLPFDVSTISGPLSGDNVQAMVLNKSEGSGTGFDASTGVLTLNFSEISTSGEQQGLIPAGKPFIIRWGTPESNPGTALTDPVFQSVTIDNSDDAIAQKTQTSTDGTVSFKGTYAKQEYTEENHSILLLGAENTLYWPKPKGNTNPSIGAFRAYFELGGGQQARQFVLNFGDDSEGTGIISVSKESGSKGVTAAWYTLDGRKLDAQPTKKGLYIHGGRKVAIK